MEDIFDKRIITVPVQPKNIGVDTNDEVVKKVAEGEEATGLSQLSTISMDRDMAYNQIDDMCSDSRMASALEAYAEEATCIGNDGRIVYVDSMDTDVAKMVTHFLDAMNIDKYIYSWAYSLIKYGDVYIRMYRRSDVEPDYMRNRKLDETLEVNYYNKNVDPYVDYCEQILNPAEMFELKKFGKTYAYIQCPIASLNVNQRDKTRLAYMLQRTRDTGDVKLFQPTEFVHGCLNQSSSRVAETLQIFDDETEGGDIYTVNRGQSLFYNVYPLWRQMQLLENSMLLNRINKNAILRLLTVEVGNVPSEEDANSIVSAVANMLQTKMSISTKTMSNLYLSDSPTVNYAVMPTKNGAGAVGFQDIGGTTGESENLDDINYYRDKLFGSLRLPKQMFGETTGDSAGFDAGGSLAQQSLRFGKAVRRIQSVLIDTITDMINLRLYDRGLTNYIDKFLIKMHFPITQEDTVNQTHRKEQIDLVLRIMDSLEGVAESSARLTILRYLLSTVIDDSDVLTAIQSELEEQSETSEQKEEIAEEEQREEREERPRGGLNAESPEIEEIEP